MEATDMVLVAHRIEEARWWYERTTREEFAAVARDVGARALAEALSEPGPWAVVVGGFGFEVRKVTQ